jgi:mRNA interferase MazF
LDLKRGDIVTVAPPGDFGKPRPALVIQSRIYPETELITVALITSDQHSLPNFRIPIEPTGENGLNRNSYVMVDMVQTFKRSKIGSVIGVADAEILKRFAQVLLVFFGFDRNS